MPLDATVLGAAIKTAIQASGDPSLGSNGVATTSITDLANAIASAVVTHIKTNAVVTGAAAGVTAGAASAVVTGTIT